jgi:sulfite reductase beta subunit-like hemoprotein
MTTQTRADLPGRVIPIIDEEFADFETEAQAFLRGEREEPKFIGFRLKQGCYGQRQADVQMLRVKLPMGGVSSEQMDAFGDVVDTYAPLKKGHITTRQNIQIHFIPLDLVTGAFRRMAEAGLSSREGCGNVVRNVTADPWAGINNEEPFDVTSYAGAYVRYWVRNEITQLLPRKWKTYFTGRESDRPICEIHDLAFIAKVRDGVHGFEVLVGGGLSTSAKHAVVVNEFVPVDEFLRYSEALLRIFNEADELRKNIHKARIKFLVHRLGVDAFREKVDEYLSQDWAQEARPTWQELAYLDDEDAAAPAAKPDAPTVSDADRAEFERFVANAVRAQKQTGYNAIEVQVWRGDLSGDQFRGLASIMRTWGNERGRVTWGQNFALRWIPDAHLYGVWKDLQALNMGAPDAGQITDVISCPGTDSCKLGITSSMGLNTAIREKLAQLDIDDEATRRIRIHMSGCPNSCGQHHIANIGYHGAAIKQGRRQIPAYLVYLAGSYKEGAPLRMGTLVPLRLPAKRVPEATERFLSLYQRERKDGEEFNDYFDRVGADPFVAAAKDLTLPPEFGEENLPMFIDWEREGLYVLERGEGECAV